MNKMPCVEVLIDRCSANAPSRAVSEWMRAYAILEWATVSKLCTDTLDDDATKTMYHKDDRPFPRLIAVSIFARYDG